MFKLQYLVLFFFLSFVTYAQDSYYVQGQVLDINTQQPLESANVLFSVVKDSLKLGSTTTDKSGLFKLRLKKSDNPVVLNVSYIGHEIYKDELAGISENRDLGTIYLFSSENMLKDVVITSGSPPIVVKQDTLEYNAASFKLRPDDNVDALLKELPGFVVDDDGKISVNGKEVSQVLVNGKAFFGKDGAVALQNLPAEIINKIQVSDFKTKKEELAGDDAASDFLSVNLTIDEKKNKGYFGKFLGGYGTDDRYEGSFLVNQFDNKQRISAVGSINNINLSGFSIDEAFGDDDTQRGSSRGTTSNGPTISRKGITQTNLVGLNYFNEWSDTFDSTGDYSFNNSVNNNAKKSTLQRFLPTGNLVTDSDSEARSENNSHKVNLELNYKPTKFTQISIEPKFRKTNYENNGNSSSFTKDENGDLLNENIGTSMRTSDGFNFDNQINLNKNFQKKSRNLNFSVTNNNSDNENMALNNSRTVSYVKNETIIRNQVNNNQVKRDNYYLGAEFTEPVSKVLRLRVGVDYRWENIVTDEKTFNFDDASQSYSQLVDTQSSFVVSKQYALAPKMGVYFDNKVFSFNVRNSTFLVNYDNHSLYRGNVTNLKSNYIIPEWHSQLKYRIDRSNYALLKYDYRVTLPNAFQLLPVVDISSTVNTIVGNPDLEPIKKHSINFSFRNYNIKDRSGYSIYMRGDVIDTDVVTTRVYAEDGTSNTTYQNIHNTYNASLSAYWNKSIKNEGNSFRYGLGLQTAYGLDRGFINNVFYDANVLSLSPRLYFSYNYGQFLTISPSYNFSYNESRYENFSINARSNVVHRASLKTTNFFGEKLVLSNDFGYSYNSNSSGGAYNNAFYLWNASLGYTFLNKTLTARLKVYDILNQNQGYTRSITDTSIRDEENTVLKRYGMISLIYKIKNFGGMKPPEPKSEGNRDSDRGSGRKSDRSDRGDRGDRSDNSDF
ncbi:outer membrane beta-barrel protein [Flavobacterium sp. UMI-01]|uniref:outer membrane beta-barrel protein n=1 Tax=Flavobacterium sp. UMI-01 TaxID=1441053 RepID=UPI001C7DB788|nr:outer membrane beta-barrel protein [Flavobacterium sp. UMI-01]GIZ08862.1 phage tail protein [Flavobacterium sp. UMI-01]